MNSREHRRQFVRYGLLTFFSLVFIISAFLLLRFWEKSQSYYPSSIVVEEVVRHNGREYVIKDNLESFLVIGLDKFQGDFSSDSYNNDKQADFLILLVFDHGAKTCSALHINRDTMTNVNVLGVNGNKVYSSEKQIALAHAYGNGREVSCRNTSDAVSELLLGIKVNHYISMTMDAVSIINDMLGGVSVEVLDDFSVIDPTLIKGEVVTLTGDQALTYVRSRAGLDDSSNANRMKRQQQYINAAYDQMQLLSSEFDDLLVESALKLSDYIVSDRSLNQLRDLATKFKEYTFTDIYSFDGEFKIGTFMEFYPNKDSIKDLVVKVFYEPKDIH